MSNPIQSVPTPTGEFQAHFGGAPGSADLAADCKKWENLCGELLAEREALREELAKTQNERDQYLKTLYYFMCKDYVCPYTSEELLSFVGSEPPLRDFIDQLEREAESAI